VPFLAPIVGFVTSTIAAGGLGAFALRLGASLLLSAASRALQKKAQPAASGLQGRTVTVREPIAPREIVYGRTRKGGVIIFMNAWAGPRSSLPAGFPLPPGLWGVIFGGLDSDKVQDGKDDAVLELVIVLAAHRVKSIGRIYFNGVVAFEADSGTATGQWTGRAGCERALGGDDQVAFTTGLGSMLPSLWTRDHRLAGCAAIKVSLGADPKAYPSGIPNITADIEGKNDIYDPRSGTRYYTDNAALCVADYMSLSPFGLGAEIGAFDGINPVTLAAAANVCDETVDRVGGGTELRYSCNGVVSLGVSPKENIEQMLTAMAGTCAWSAGQWDIFAGAYRIPSVTLGSNDVREGGLQLDTRQSRAANFNAVRGTFISPENDWQPDDFPAYASSVYQAEDGGERIWRDISLPFTISASAAQRLAKIELERQRRQQTFEFAGKLNAWQVAVGDVVMFNYAPFGFSAKPFDVTGMSLDFSGDGDGPQLVPNLTLRETSPLVYDWSASEAQIYAAAPRTRLPSAYDISEPGIPTAVEQLYATRNGTGVKVLVRLTWAAAPSAFVLSYQVEGRRNGGAWAFLGRSENTSLEALDITPGLWDFRVQASSRLGYASEWVQASLEVLGLAAAPSAITGLTIQSAGGLAVLKWAQHPDLDVRIGGFIVIRHSAAVVPSWSNSVSMDRVPGATAIGVVPLKPGAYVLRAQDSIGNLGPESVISTAGAVALNFTGVGTLTEDSTFTGAKTGCFLNAGTLQISSSSQVDSWPDVDAIADIDAEGGVLPSATYVFATGINAGAVTRMRLRSQIDLSILNITDQIDTKTGDIDTWLNIDGERGDEVDVVVEVRTTQTNPSGSPVWGDWGRADSTEVSAWGVQARAILTTRDPNFNPSVSQLRLIAERVV
jgi:hypothetical protein